MTDKPFIDRLWDLIKELTNGNKKKFAEILGISPSNINSWINEGYLPKIEHLANIQQKLHVNINWLLTGEGDRYIKKEKGELVKEEPAPYYTKKEREYIDKLVEIFQTKDEETIQAITQNIDTFLKVPSVKKKLEENPTNFLKGKRVW